ncbi:MAG: hypothetical protein MMC23_005302 [Stictis urceolatum]|nr:hypothetical protein [Stictis urceolata]
MFGRLPAIPRSPTRTSTYTTGSDSVLAIEASSMWRANADNGCGVDGKQRTIQADLQIGYQRSTAVYFSGDCFRHWQPEHNKKSTGNFLGLLALGWAYIPSARLVESQGKDGAKIIYMDSRTIGNVWDNDGRPDSTRIDIGKVDPYCARWWAAILAPLQGWKAIISEHAGEIYQTPWLASIEDARCIGINWVPSTESAAIAFDSAPSSSAQALDFLQDFCCPHGLESQIAPALAAALLLPAHNYYGTAA